MATTTNQYRIMQKTAAEEYLILHPETDAEIVLLASEKLTSTNVKDAVEELYTLIQDITGGGVVTGVKGSAETEYRLGNVEITAANIGLGNVDNTSDADKPISTATQEALDKKQDALTFDSTPTADSTNPVTSGGVYTAIEDAKTALEAEIPDVSSFIDNTVSDLVNYYTKSETYTQAEVNELVSAIPKFSIEVVASLPTEDISTTTVYLLANSETSTENLYTEYIYVNSKWEKLGEQTVDLSGYYKKTETYSQTEVDALLGDYYKKTETYSQTEVDSAISTALTTALADYVKTTDLTTKLADYYTKAETDALLDAKQDELTFDATPTEASENPVTSGGVYTAIETVSDAAETAQKAADDAATAAETAQSTADDINDKLSDTTIAGSYSAVNVNAAGVVISGAQVVEVWASGQTSSDTLAVGGIAFVEV